MKIKNKFIIPVLAIMVALIMTGAPVATVAADTEASEESTSATTTTDPRLTHPYSNTTTTEPTTADLDATINSVVSGIFGENADEIGGEVNGAIDSSNGFLKLIKSFIDKLIAFTKKIGDFLSGGFSIGNILGSLTTTAPTTTPTTTTSAQ